MNNSFLAFFKITLLAFYVLAAGSSFVPGLSPYSQTLHYLVLLTVVLHVGEYLFVRKRLSRLSLADRNHFVGTLLFGLFYWVPLIRCKSQ